MTDTSNNPPATIVARPWLQDQNGVVEFQSPFKFRIDTADSYFSTTPNFAHNIARQSCVFFCFSRYEPDRAI